VPGTVDAEGKERAVLTLVIDGKRFMAGSNDVVAVLSLAEQIAEHEKISVLVQDGGRTIATRAA
jgi:hypothetical protein